MLVKHLRDINHCPVATIVGDDNGRIGLSVCSIKDNFCKRIGTNIALGRAKSDHFNLEDFITRRCPSRYIDFKNKQVPLWSLLNEECQIMKNRVLRRLSQHTTQVCQEYVCKDC